MPHQKGSVNRLAAQVSSELHESPIKAAIQGNASWIYLTDEDRNRAFESLPDGLEGFLKKWGWLHFAKSIESACKDKNIQAAKKDRDIAMYSDAEITLKTCLAIEAAHVK
jgi:hypothetical protein